MKESTIIMRDGARSPSRKALAIAMEETMGLYHAWLRYLLTLTGTDTLRVKASDVTAVAESASCTVTREGDEYVIRLNKPKGS